MKRSTWVLLIIIAALAAFILLFERKTPSTDEAVQQKSRLFAEKFEDAKSLSRSGFEPMALKRKDEERWDLETPVSDRADRFSVDGFMDRLKETEVTRWVEGATAKELGLDPPRAAWAIEDKNGRDLLDMGAEAPLDAGLYVRANGRVALIPKSLEETLLRPVQDFRSKELVASPEQEVRRFSMVSAVGREILAFERDGGAWRVTAPFKDAGDSGKLQTILDDVCLCPINGVVEDNPKDLAKYELDSPERSIKLEMKSGAPVTVRLGGPVPGGDAQKALIYAYSSDRPSVFSVSSNSIKSLAQDSEGLRSLALFSHDPYEADRIEVKGGFTIAIVKDAKGMWAVEKPAAGTKAENGFALFTALAGLKGTKAETPGNLKAFGLDQPFLTLVLRGKGWEENTSIGAEKDGARYAMPSGRDVALALSKDDWQTAQAALEVASGSGANVGGPKK